MEEQELARWREGYQALRTILCDLVPPGRERSLALTALDEAWLWTAAATRVVNGGSI